MQNTAIETNSPPQALHTLSDNLRDSSESLISELGKKAAKAASNASAAPSSAKEEYAQKGNAWLQQNYGKSLGFAAFLVAAGAIGYFLGRNSKRTKLEPVQALRS